MTDFTELFGGSPVLAADSSFRAVSLTDSIVTVWPPYADSGNQLAAIMKVDASVASKSITLPDCRLASLGEEVLFDNCGSQSFTVLDSAGSTVATIAAGQIKLLYLYSTATAIGAWRTTLLGVGSSSPDASQLVGYGLKAISNTLNFAPVLSPFSSNYTVTSSDRSKVFLWTGGSGTLTLPTTVSSTSDFSIEVRNEGTGTLTVAPVGGSLIDASASIALVVGESCFVHMGASDWSTVGRGRNVQFNFTRLSKVVDGGTDNLTLTEASNVVQTYTGVLLGNQIVNMPAVVQVYYVINSTTGAYTFTFGCVAGGTSVAVASGQAAILFCDGTNIINANTSLSGGITALVFASGSVGAPSVAIGTATNGWYSPGANELAASLNGVQSVKIDSVGCKVTGSGSVTLRSESTAGAAQSVVDRPAAQTGSFRLRTATSDRWSLNANNVAESGANAGSNLELFAYDDAGASLGSVFTIARATRVLTFTVAPAGLQATSEKDASGGYAGLTLFKLNLRNAANTITSWFTTAATVARTWTLPDKDGTVAMTSDITGGTSAGSFTSLNGAGDLTLTGAARRIVGDFSNATVANRTLLQTSAVNSLSSVTVIPNGTSPGAYLVAANNSNPTNASVGYIGIDASVVTVASAAFGSGTLLPMVFSVNGGEAARIDTSKNLLVTSPALLGYGTGAGGSVVQATSKSTAVTLNKPTGAITTASDALASNAAVLFLVNNSLLSADDTVVVSLRSGDAAGGSYGIQVAAVQAGGFYIQIRNQSAGSRSEALAINFAVIKGVTA